MTIDLFTYPARATLTDRALSELSPALLGRTLAAILVSTVSGNLNVPRSGFTIAEDIERVRVALLEWVPEKECLPLITGPVEEIQPQALMLELCRRIERLLRGSSMKAVAQEAEQLQAQWRQQ